MIFQSVNPATEEIIAEYPEISPEECHSIIQNAHKAFQQWRRTSLAEREIPLRNAARILRERKEEFARLMALEMGKPLAQGVAEIEKCALNCEFYADKAKEFLADEIIPTEARKSYVTFQPLGVVLAIMPWNFPFWQVFRFLAPALIAGNAAILKHAPNVFGCGAAIEEIIREAGFPDGLFRSLVIDISPIDRILSLPEIQAVTFTGSVPAGRIIAGKAGAVGKKSVLELGGSDPYIVLADANIEQAAQMCVASRLTNNGETCIAAKRWIVVESVREKFEKIVVEIMRAKTMGNPPDGTFDIGPLARKDLRDALHKQVESSRNQGAELLLGGEIPNGKGWFYPPTVLTNVTPEMSIFREETFGPVAAIISARDENEAITLANMTEFGLGAAVFTENLERGERIAAEFLDAGSCFVNVMVKSDSRLPFGGIKSSGFGRELGSFGIREFTNIKTVLVG